MNVAFVLSSPLPRTQLSYACSPIYKQSTFPKQASAPKRPRHPTLSLNPPSVDDPIIEGPFDGAYGQWFLTKSEADGVTQYRQALSIMAGATTVACFIAFGYGTSCPSQVYDALYLIFTAAFGFSLQKIHIYAKPMHQALKALWTLGAGGAAGMLVSPQTAHSIVLSAYQNPILLLAIGWQFVALTGLFIKEAFCFGRAEALALIALIPILSGGHFAHLLSVDIERYTSIFVVAMFLVFSFRKFTQPAKDDIGDLSIFQHLAKGGQL